MAAPTPKRRAVTLKREGFDEGVIGAILGLDPDDVRSLLYEADPDVSISSGGGVPALRGIPILGVNFQPMPDLNDDVEVWDDLHHVTAPSDAALYWFKVIVSLSCKAAEGVTKPGAWALATDSDGFDAWWNDSELNPIPGVECSMGGDAVPPGTEYATLRATLLVPVGPGQVVGLAEAEAGSTSTVTWTDACWIPFA